MNQFGQKSEQDFLAVIGDLRRSREDRERLRTQTLLERALKEVNATFAGNLSSRFIITLGDEFQGLLRMPSGIFDVIREIDRILEGLPLRYGLGWGALSTDLREQALGMDGPCFHRAREAMGIAKQKGESVVVAGFGREQDEAINRVLFLMNSVKRRWKPAQAETVRLMRTGRMQKEVARLRGVSTSVVSETLKAAQYRKLHGAESAVKILMELFADPAKLQKVGETG